MKTSDIFVAGKLNRANAKVFFKPLLGLIAIGVCGLILINFAIARITLKFAELKSAQEAESSLAAKVDKLSEGKIGSLESANTLVVALPEKNPVLVMISQLKKLSQEKTISLGRFEVSSAVNDASWTSALLGLQFSGDGVDPVLDYVKMVTELSPVTDIKAVKITNQGDNKFSGSLELAVFWSAFPETIPSVSQPIMSLTQAESNELERISQLRQPDYQIIDASAPVVRIEPFN